MKKEIEYALNAVADALRMSLEYHPGSNPFVTGDTTKTFEWFGATNPLTFKPRIVHSLIDEKRSIVVVLVHFKGMLYGCMISDGDQQKLSMMMLDGSKMVSGDTLPKYWVREKLYANIVAGLKATYVREFNEPEWRLFETGAAWMRKYLDDKNSNRSAGRPLASGGTVG